MHQTLSQVLGKIHIKLPVIKAVNCNVKEIDTIPTQFISATQLLLSQNKISSLAGLVQFQKLEKLSLSANVIDDFDEISYLTPIENLHSLRMDLNPISNHPLYRLKLIYQLPQLDELDGICITQNDKLQSQVIIAEVFQKEQLLISEISAILDSKQSKLDPQRVLYEKVLKCKFGKPRAPWRTIYNLVAIEIQNELSSCQQNFSMYKTFMASQTQPTQLSPSKRVASGKVQISSNTQQLDPENTYQRQTQMNLENEQSGMQNQSVKKSAYLNEDLLNSDTYRPQVDKEEVLKMKNQLETLKNQIQEYQVVNEENIKQSVEKVNQLKQENEKKQQVILDLEKANRTYQQSIVESKQKQVNFEKQILKTEQNQKTSDKQLVMIQTKNDKLQKDCNLLAQEIITFKKHENFKQIVNKLRLQWSYQLFKLNTHHKLNLNLQSNQIDTKLAKKLKVKAFQQLKHQIKLYQKANSYLQKTENRNFRSIFKSWKALNFTLGYRPHRQLIQNQTQADDLRSYILKQIPFKILTITVRKLIFKTKNLLKISQQVQHTHNQLVKMQFFELIFTKFNNPKQLGKRLVVAENRQIKRVYLDNWRGKTNRLERAKSVSDILVQVHIKNMVQKAFQAFYTRYLQFEEYNSTYNNSQQVLLANYMKFWYEKLKNTQKMNKFSHFISLRNTEFAERQQITQTRQTFTSWLLLTSKVIHSPTNQKLCKFTFSALRSALFTLQYQNFANFKQKSLNSSESAQNLTEKLHLEQQTTEKLTKQITIFKQELAKFHAQSKQFLHENELLKQKISQNAINNQRNNTIIKDLRERLELEKTPAEESENPNYYVKSERQNIEIQMLRNAISGVQSENQLLKQKAKTANNSEIVQDLLEKSQNSYTQNRENRVKIDELQCEIERLGSENEVLRNVLSQKSEGVEAQMEKYVGLVEKLKTENLNLRENVKNLDLERKIYIQKGLGVGSVGDYVVEDISQKLLLDFM